MPVASQGVQAWDRYAYVNNNPIKYTDPTGHDVGGGGKDASEAASDTVVMIACGVKDGPCNYNTETMHPAYDYAVENGYQAHFYDPDDAKYNSNYAKYDMAEDMANMINGNTDNNFYIFGYSAGGASSALAAKMTNYSGNIKGVGLIDPYVDYTQPDGVVIEDNDTTLNPVYNIPSQISLAVAMSSSRSFPPSITNAQYADDFDFGHTEMGTEQSVFDFLFESIFK